MKFALPHISTYKRRWVRRLVLVLTYPIEAARMLYEGQVNLARLAVMWWSAP